MPVKFGISFTRRTLNQGNALVNIYLDGTVQVSTGGTEMGQGLNTKIRQLVADEFALPLEAVQVMVTSTEKNNNTSPTAASASTDLNGTAAVRACQILKGRLAPVAAALLAAPPDGIAAEPERVEFREGAAVDPRVPGAGSSSRSWSARLMRSGSTSAPAASTPRPASTSTARPAAGAPSSTTPTAPSSPRSRSTA